MKRRIVFILFMISIIQSGFSQSTINAEFEHISIKEGLPHREVRCIMQDSRGFMWFGTWGGGLIRYDGYSCKVYKHIPGDIHSLSNDVINKICEDPEGNIWIASLDGLNKFNVNEEKFYIYKNTPGKMIMSGNDLNDVKCGRDGIVWFISWQGKGINSYNIYTHEFQTYKTDNTGINGSSVSIHIDNDSIIYFERNNIPVVLNTNTGKISMLPFEFSASIWVLYKGKEPNLWMGSWDKGLFRYDINQKKTYNYVNNPGDISSLPDNKVLCLFEDRNSTLWIGTSNGLCVYNRERDNFIQVVSEPGSLKGLSNGIVHAICQSRDGLIWIGTRDGGVNVYNPNPKRFSNHIIKTANFVLDAVTALHEGKNKLWIGTWSGAVKYIDKIKSEEIIDHAVLPSKHKSISANAIKTLYEEEDGILVAGTDGSGIFKFNPGDRNPHAADTNNLYAFAYTRDKWGRTWIANWSGYLEMYDKNEFYKFSKEKNNLTSATLTSILIDKNDILWVGSRQYGLNRIQLKANTRELADKFWVQTFTADNKQSGSLNNNFVYSLYDADSVLWIGTGGGLNKLNKKDNSITYYTEKNGLSDVSVLGVLADKHGNIWVSTNNGLAKLDKGTGKFTTYNNTSDLKITEFSIGACCTTQDGRMFFGGVNGLVSFDPDSISNDTANSQLAFTDLKIFNESVIPGRSFHGKIILEESIQKAKKIRIPYGLNSFSIEFSSLHFVSSKNNMYSYKMEGFDNDWINVNSDRRFATYTNLDPGNYVFRVFGSNSDGAWNREGISIEIEILPPFWKTWWFRIMIAVIALASIIVIFRLRLRAVENQKKILETQVKERTAEVMAQKEEIQMQAENLMQVNLVLKDRQEEIQSQSDQLAKLNATKDKIFSIIAHDLRNPFHAITNFSDLLISDSVALPDASRQEYLEAIKSSSMGASGLLENLLQWARVQTGSIAVRSESFEIFSVIKEVNDLLELNSRSKNIHVDVFCKKNIFVLADRNMITTVVRNIVSNAVKFTPEGGTITISVKENMNRIQLSISDTGVGMDKDTLDKIFRQDTFHSSAGTSGEKGTGLGLAICKDFVERNNGKLLAESEPGKGALFIISLPLSDEHGQSLDDTKEPSFAGKEVKAEIPQVATIDEQAKREIHVSEILLVDDDPAILKSIRDKFAGRFLIREALNGKEALAIAFKTIPDLIVSDVVMPEMDGLEFCKRIKSDERTSHIPVIMVTAQDSEQQQITGIETGADDYIVKPFNINVLAAKIKNLIDSRKKLRKQFSKELTIGPLDTAIGPLDQKFIHKCIKGVEDNLAEPDFGVDELAGVIGLSRAQLYRKLNALIDESPMDFIRNMRLKRSAQMMLQGETRISDIAYQVGFKDISHFRKCFKAYFNISPSEYVEKNQKK